MIAVAAVSGAMALAAPAHADSSADGGTAGSPGLISGNTVQLPVHVPVEVCGNTVNVVGLLNPASGNRCADEDGHRTPGASAAHGSRAHGGGKDSPGVLSGNAVQLPVHVPVNVSGNTVNVVGVGNAADDNDSANTSGNRPPTPTHRTPKPPAPPKPHPAPEHTAASLAHTGTNATLPAAATSAALILAGAAVYRRSRSRTDR
ncbi:chaplin [Streptomyces sp. CME 23]|nr:chaplin [Streptomyces sp. CME 23]MCH5672066.1 chaplin [Streptomyces sp. CME 23]